MKQKVAKSGGVSFNSNFLSLIKETRTKDNPKCITKEDYEKIVISSALVNLVLVQGKH